MAALQSIRKKGALLVGVLGATDIIWKESKQDLNTIPGLTDMVEGFLRDIQDKGMVETVKSIL